MSARDETNKLLQRAGVTPFRRVGKVLAVYDPRTPAETVGAALEVVRRVTRGAPDIWDELPDYEVGDLHKRGMAVADVCDEPCPREVDPAGCAVEWLVARCARYHFRVVAAPPGGIAFAGLDGWDVATVAPLLPQWFADVCKSRRPEIIAFVLAQPREAATAPSDGPPADDAEDESCAVCGRVTDARDRAVLATNHYLCDRTECPSKVAARRAENRAPRRAG